MYDAIIIGAGAAGLFCAAIAGQRGRRVLLLEHNREIGAKILISGGGRCNFTNIHTAAEHFISSNPDFARSALARYTPDDFRARVAGHGIATYEKTLGQMFCEGAGSARKIVKMLADECAAGGVDTRTGIAIHRVSRADLFEIDTSHGAFAARALILATGGLSIPKLGATDFTHRIATQFRLRLVAPRPGLVPLAFGPDDLAWMRPLSGASADIVATARSASFREAALFTHRGLSGPAILQASSYWEPGASIIVDWAPDAGTEFLVAAKRARPRARLKAALETLLPVRVAATLSAHWPVEMLGDQKDSALVDMARALKAWRLHPIGTEGYSKAEVTVGGVDTDALDQRTMGVRDVPGLFIIGEAVDVTGWLGGYNFQWAWASGHAAGVAL